MTFKHPPTPPAIPTTGLLAIVPARVEHVLSRSFPDVPGALRRIEEELEAEMVENLRERYGEGPARAATDRGRWVLRPPAWPGDVARLWLTVTAPAQ